MSLTTFTFASQSDDENSPSETREITLEEFSAMLHKYPSLVAELAEQFGVETTDPQEIVELVIAQMQQQVQPPSGDLDPVATEPPAIYEQSQSESPIVSDRTPNSQLPAPPPAPKLEYKPEDPWSADRAATHGGEQLPEAVNMPDRGV